MRIECQKKINSLDRGRKYYKGIIQRIRVPVSRVDVKYCDDNSEDLGVPLAFCRFESECTIENVKMINKKLLSISRAK